MADTIINLVKGDYGFNIGFTVKDDDGDVVDLTSSTVKFKVGRPGVVESDLVINGTCVVDDAENGICHFTPTSGLLDTAGVFRGELQIDYSNKIISDRTFQVIIRGDLGT